MSYTLYYAPGACSLAVHVALNEMQQDVDLIKVDMKNKSDEWLKANPRGQVPTLITPEGTTLIEGAAILMYLAETHCSPLLPATGPERYEALKWLMTANSSLHPAYGACIRLKMSGQPTEAALPFQKKVEQLWQEIEKQLGETGAYIAGSELTLGDILLTVLANWQTYIPQPISFGPNCKRLFTNVTSRDSFKKALDNEHVDYKAAA